MGVCAILSNASSVQGDRRASPSNVQDDNIFVVVEKQSHSDISLMSCSCTTSNQNAALGAYGAEARHAEQGKPKIDVNINKATHDDH
eukprot:6175803-Pleurochrysis_carterae.AAC.3